MTRLARILFSATCAVSAQHATATAFAPGHYYATHYDDFAVSEYSPTGSLIRTVLVDTGMGNARSIRGLAYGPDGLMYGVVEQTSNYSVIAFDGDGNIRQTYQQTGQFGNISYGKITFDLSGTSFYVGEGAGLSRFSVGESFSASRLYSQAVYDTKVLPSGNLLFATGSSLFESTPTGSILRTINLSDPSSILDTGFARFTDIRGIEWSASDSSIYVSMLGTSSAFFQTMRLDANGVLLDANYFNYADDLFVDADGNVIVGSRTQAPGKFSPNLTFLGSFDFQGGDKMFVTQVPPVPLPAAIWLIGSALAALALMQRRWR